MFTFGLDEWAGQDGNVAFVDPDTPEFAAGSLEEYMQMGSRLTLHAPPTPQLPTTVYVSEVIAMDIECMERVGY